MRAPDGTESPVAITLLALDIFSTYCDIGLPEEGKKLFNTLTCKIKEKSMSQNWWWLWWFNVDKNVKKKHES